MDRKDRLTANDFPPEVLRLFDGFVHGTKTRREFLDGAAKFATGSFTAAAMLQALQPNFAWAQQVKKDDPRIKTENVEYDSPQGHGKMRGLLALPAKAAGKLPGVIVIHENRGLNPYIEDVARRLAVLNFIAFAPDALFPVGGYPGDEDKGRALFAKQDTKKRIEDLAAGVAVLKARPEFSGKWGSVDFCFGGGIVNLFATRFPDMAAGVAYYGVQPAASAVPNIKAAIMIHNASDDARINDGHPAYEEAMKANKVRFEHFSYPNTQHGFHNDTTPRFDEAAAKLSWERTVGFFNKHLR
ncbi:MAG: dienelactone hydrolase family protein [Betaproteobacteria bacterium]|nr:dienelactone hydrolase family protein [Betaproteobacteria bacterium]